MKQLHAVAAQVVDDAVAAPQAAADTPLGVDQRDVRKVCYLLAQVVATGGGGIEPQVEPALCGQVAYQCATVAAQPCCVADYSLGVESDGGHER